MRIAIIGDLHYPSELINHTKINEEARDAYYKRFMDSFLSIQADYHISLGDLTHAGEVDEFNQVLSGIEGYNVHFLHVLGNHDTYTHPKEAILRITKQQRYGVIEHPDALILLLDTARECRDNWGGMIDEEQLAWLELQMNRKADKPLLVFGHHPLYNTTARSTETMMSLDPDVEIWPILERWAGIGFYFNGHNHIHSIIRKEQWHFIQTAAVPDVPAVRMVTVDPNEVKLDTVSFANEEWSEWASGFNGNMFDYEKYPNAEGDSSAERLVVSGALAKKGQVEHK
ncbi:metallophosphoesterase family protein [Paenibacillus gorillae]|uniref:metallophosphoesterase family protein n=1 Tax=Paenibacillus gorillae TaxID=1243662 RepID=UPI0004B7082B|nr:metallophosphoesterase [Paenibacillus gorillae]